MRVSRHDRWCFLAILASIYPNAQKGVTPEFRIYRKPTNAKNQLAHLPPQKEGGTIDSSVAFAPQNPPKIQPFLKLASRFFTTDDCQSRRHANAPEGNAQ
jgi:hypothetical protein